MLGQYPSIDDRNYRDAWTFGSVGRPVLPRRGVSSWRQAGL